MKTSENYGENGHLFSDNALGCIPQRDVEKARESSRVLPELSQVAVVDDAESERIAEMTYDDWLRDKVVYGTPDRVVDRLRQLIEELQLTQIVYEINFGRKIPYEQQKNCLRLITEQVVPSFK